MQSVVRARTSEQTQTKYASQVQQKNLENIVYFRVHKYLKRLCYDPEQIKYLHIVVSFSSAANDGER